MTRTATTVRVALCAIALSLLVVTPALRADPGKWKGTIDKWVEADAKNPPKQNHVLFVGSSSIRMWDTDKYFPELKPINRGFGGSQFEDVLAYMDQIVLPYKPRVIVVYEGDNDIGGGKTPQRVLDDWKKFVGIVHDKLPKTHVIFIAIKPSIKRWNLVEKIREANKMIAEDIAKDPLSAYADIDAPMIGDDGKPRKELFKSDGLHMVHEGYVIWTNLVQKLIDAASAEK
ncbi:MAG: hypothetical protein GC159_04935 [Phycisphaera sp.]|nr:hypothetical protein [Phycisphaera sp.]